MAEMKETSHGELLCGMNSETLRLYETLSGENKAKVTRLIETLLNRQSNDPQLPDSPV